MTNKITVVVPTFNSKNYITQCVQSVLSQDFPEMEIWACDNESTDGTYEYLKSLNDKRLQVFSLKNIYPNGYREAIEFVFQNTKTEWITFICSDDFIQSNYISNCMHILEKKPEIKCMQSPIRYVQNNQITETIATHFYRGLDDFKRQCLTRSPVNNPSVIYHKSLWSLLEGEREAHKANNLPDKGAGDYDTFCKFADNNVYIYPVKMFLGYFYRFHPKQMTWIVHKQGINYDKMIQDYWRKKWKI